MSDDILKEELFDGKTVSGLLNDIFKKTEDEDEIIKQTIENLMAVFTNTSSSTDDEEQNEIDYESIMGFAAPLIKDFIDISVKNKKHYIELAQVAQRFLSTNKQAQIEADNAMPWKARKAQIIKEAKAEAIEIEKSQSSTDVMVKKKLEELDERRTETLAN